MQTGAETMMARRAKGEGTVYYDETRDSYVGQGEASPDPLTGKRRRVKVRAKTKREASKRLRARLEELEALRSSGDTVERLLESWLTKAAPRRMSPNTLAMVRSMVTTHLMQTLGSVKITELRVEDVEAVLEAKTGDLARSSLVKLRSYLAQAYDFAIRRRWALWNPARVAEIPTDATSTREPRTLTGPELRSLLNVCSAIGPDPEVERGRYAAWVVVAVTLGLRPGEVSALQWDDIKWDGADIEGGTIAVVSSLSWVDGIPTLKPTKTKTVRVLDAPRVTVQVLQVHRTRQAEERLLMGERWPMRWSDLVFVTSNGTPLDPSNVRRFVSDIAEDAGIEGHVTPYDLRHTTTSLLSASGAPPERLADMLGHRDTRMVFRHYRHPVTPTVSTARDYLNDALEL